MLKTINFTTNALFNNTLYNSGAAGSESSAKPNKTNDNIHPFQIFSNATVADLSVINRFIVRPAYKYLSTQLQNGINDSMAGFRLIYIIIFAVYFALLAIFYLFIWRPFEINLNQTVIYFNIDL
jgi:hypothetical protein